MLGAARAYAEANQATLLTPFILAGAMAPVTAAGVAAQTLAEALAGMTFVQLVRPGAPVVLGSFATLDVDAVGRADVRDAGARARPVRDGRAGPPPRRPVPLRRLAVRLQGRRRPGRLRERRDAPADRPRRGQLRPPRRRLAGGRAGRRLREVHPRRRPVRDDGRLRQGRRHVRERPGARRDPGQRPGPALPGHRPHAGQLRDRVLPLARSPTTTSFEQWQEDGSLDAAQRANADLEADAARVRGAAARRRRSTRRCSSSSSGARRRCPTRRSDGRRCSAAGAASTSVRAPRSRAPSRTRSSSCSRSRTCPTRSRTCRPAPACR